MDKINLTKDESPSESGKGFQGKQLSFLPTPEFCPILPPAHSAAAVALDDLLRRDISQVDWLREGKGWRLAAAIKELGYLGWEPKSILVLCRGWSKPIARYSLGATAKRTVFALRTKEAHA
jgi:hypothetical protein